MKGKSIMDNKIVSRQNEDTSINYLAAQRQLYNEAKNLDNLGILFSVFLPLCCAILQSIFHDNIYLNSVSYILSILSMIVSLLLNSYVSQKKKQQPKYNNILIHMFIKCLGIINYLARKKTSHMM